MKEILIVTIGTPILGAFLTINIPKKNEEKAKQIALVFSMLTFFISLNIWIFFDNSTASFQYIYEQQWIKTSNIYFTFGVDGISLFFIILTTLLVPTCLLTSWSLTKNKKVTWGVKEYFSIFLVIESFILIVFLSLDILIFYVFFESVLIPIFFIIGVWGSRERKVRAAYIFFIYTLLGSLFILFGIMLIYFEVGSLNYETLVNYDFEENRQKLLWISFFISFAVKVPIFPVHVWLPEAHVEAPTAGSVILAGILLKLGTYGLIRYSIPMFPTATNFYTPIVYTLAVTAVIYTSFAAIRQTDIKRVIAYASVAHINITIIGLFSLNFVGIEGAILQILSHGLVSGALFICVGILYERHHSRLITYYGGTAQIIPNFVIVFLFFTIANIALPGTSSFVGEFIILAGTFTSNNFVALIAATGIVLGSIYALWLYNRVAYGNTKIIYLSEISKDITRRELIAISPLIFLTILMGIYPNLFLEPQHITILALIQQGNL